MCVYTQYCSSGFVSAMRYESRKEVIWKLVCEFELHFCLCWFL